MSRLTKRHAAKRDAARRRARVRRIVITSCAALIVAVMVAAFFAFRGGGGGRTTAHVRQQPVTSDSAETSVKVFDNDFEPRDLTVHRGSTITWDFKGKRPHNVTDDNGGFASETLAQGDSWQFVADKTGVFTYSCTLHHAMQGTLTVID
jgi:plastocyanin